MSIDMAKYPLCEVEEKIAGKPTIKGGVKELQGFFGRRSDQSLSDFAAEIKPLSFEDKLQLVQGIRDGSLNY